MKKFVFTNEKYQGIKENEYERLKLDMQNVDKEIDMENAALKRLEENFDTERERFAADCRRGVGARGLLSYQSYFDYLQQERSLQLDRLAKLHERKRELTEALLAVHNELRVLEEMRQEQYQQYCKEVAADEAKELDAHISFTIYERAV